MSTRAVPIILESGRKPVLGLGSGKPGLDKTELGLLVLVNGMRLCGEVDRSSPYITALGIHARQQSYP